MLKKIFGAFYEAKEVLKDDRKKNDAILKIFTSKKLFIYGMAFNLVALGYYLVRMNETNYDISLSRFVSKIIGSMGDITIPVFMRKHVYSAYMSMYKVNRDEILDQNLENYKSIKEFFIRHIDLNIRPIENKSTDVLSSPCDGKILSFSEVKNLKDLIIVKDVRYNLGEFLFGKFKDNFPDLSENLYNLDKKFYQITIYLSPGDCHRYYSPNSLYVSQRVYIPGFLEPVKPSYVERHPKVFATNERVTLKCEQDGSDNLLFITYVGALNVGSINLSFDDFLKTNVKISKEEKKDPGFYVVKYSDILTPSQKKIERPQYFFYRPKAPLLFRDLDEESSEFDMRDILDLDIDFVKNYKINLDEVKIPFNLFKERFLFEKINHDREDVKYNFGNSFLSYDLEIHKKKQKLSNPKELNLEKFKMSSKGVHMEKKEEMGWFNFGSTIVLVFAVDKDKNVKFMHKPGEAVKIGQTLYEYI